VTSPILGCRRGCRGLSHAGIDSVGMDGFLPNLTFACSTGEVYPVHMGSKVAICLDIVDPVSTTSRVSKQSVLQSQVPHG